MVTAPISAVLELQNVHYSIPHDGAEVPLLRDINLTIKPGHFMAIVGPSGCGKTTLLKIIAGLQVETEGNILWKGRNLADDGDLQPQELGYVPQFSIAYDHLTVEESVENAARLRTRLTADARYDLADRIIGEVGLESVRERRVQVLSGGQKRRLGLAMELVSHPDLLLCDEVTSGLDPQSEREIVQLLHTLSQHEVRMVVNVTHSLTNLDLYDSVLVMYEGRVIYHGTPGAMPHYFSVEHGEEVYPCLAARPSAEWHESWAKHREAYYQKLDRRLAHRRQPIVPVTDDETPPASESAPADAKPSTVTSAAAAPAGSGARPAGAGRQFFTLLSRRWTLFFRDRVQLVLHLALLFGFPVLVVIFAIGGIDPMPDRSMPADMPVAEQLMKTGEIVQSQTKLGGLISGLVMFQVILLTLMGSNNAAREIAGERLIYEKERLGGVKPMAYLLSKVAFLAVLLAAQAVWMALFVNHFTRLPGSFGDKLNMLLLVNAAMTFVCLAISALMKSPEQASLLSIYLVGFQLPLSGAVLALPETVEKIVQPLIAAYWSWSGQLCSMRPADYFVGIQQAVPTRIVERISDSSGILWAHVIAGLAAAWLGCKRRRWD